MAPSSGASGRLVLQTPFLRLEIDLLRGGNIVALSSGNEDNWLFYDPSRRPPAVTGAERYDDVWCGGFEELFPNDAPGTFEGRVLPDHGELWNAEFEVVASGASHATLRRRCQTMPAVFEKAITLSPEAAAFTVEYRLRNLSDVPFHYLFKLHPAMRLEEGDRLLLPGGRTVPVDPGFGNAMLDGESNWPLARTRSGEAFDLSLVRGCGSGLREFVYVYDLPEGWCGLRRARTGEAIIFRFPADVFPYCWLFMTYGGWRDYCTVVLEPCTNMPKDLEAAKRRGRCALLEAHGRLAARVTVQVEEGNGN